MVETEGTRTVGGASVKEMDSTMRYGRRARTIAVLAAMLFAFLSFESMGPHHWGETSRPARAAIFHAMPICPLCDFAARSAVAATPLVVPLPEPLIRSVEYRAPQPPALSLHTLRPSGRAPPFPFV